MTPSDRTSSGVTPSNSTSIKAGCATLAGLIVAIWYLSLTTSPSRTIGSNVVPPQAAADPGESASAPDTASRQHRGGHASRRGPQSFQRGFGLGYAVCPDGLGKDQGGEEGAGTTGSGTLS